MERDPTASRAEGIGLPAYRDLPLGSAWRVFGTEDQLGTLNLLTPERIVAAAQLIRRGIVFNLDLPLHLPARPYGTLRQAPRHTILPIRGDNALDDRIDGLCPHFSSQWDALSHVAHPSEGFYNGVKRAEITGEPGTKLGIEHYAEHGIVGRGVLLDVAGHCKERLGRPIDPTSRFTIGVGLLEETAAAQRTELRPGDILLLRTGVAAHILAQAEEGSTDPLEKGFQVPGLEPCPEMVAWLWDHHFAAVAADNMAVEAWPFASEEEFMHSTLIPMLGMALGELLNLEKLAADCRADGRYECFFVASPLNLRGGVGSPANAYALK